MLFFGRPVGRCVALLVTNVHVHLLLNEEPDKFLVAFPRRDMQTGPALLVLFIELRSVVDEGCDYIVHVSGRSFMQRGVATDVKVLGNVRVRAVLQQDVDNRTILCHYSSLKPHR